MNTIEMFKEIVADGTDAILIELKVRFDMYQKPMHPNDKLILQMIDDEIEIREIELTEISKFIYE